MAREESVKVEGLAALVRALKAAEDNIDDLKDANKAAGETVLDAARPRTPVRSGRLAATGRTSRAAKKASVVFGSAAVPYAPIQHYGWAAHHIKPNPWVSEAVTATQPEWLGEYERDIQAILHAIERST